MSELLFMLCECYVIWSDDSDDELIKVWWVIECVVWVCMMVCGDVVCG